MIPLFSQISYLEWLTLLVSGFLFGVAFTITHFWALKKYIFNKKHFKQALFFLSLIRLFIFGFVLWLIINIHHNILEVLVFFATFMAGRLFTFFKAKRNLDHGKNL